MKGHSKSSITLALDKIILEEIRKDADIQGLSVNAKINSVLSDYVMFDRYYHEKGAVILEPRIFEFLLEAVDESRFLEMWRLVNSEIVPSIFMRYNIPYTVDNVVKYAFDKIGTRVGILSSVAHFKESDRHKIVIEHKFGMKWSRILATAYTERLEKLTKSRVACNILPNAILFEFRDENH